MDGNFITCTVDGPNQIHNRTPKLSFGYLSTSCCSRKPLCTLMPLSPQHIALATSFTNPTSLSPSMLSKCPLALSSLLALPVTAQSWWFLERGMPYLHFGG